MLIYYSIVSWFFIVLNIILLGNPINTFKDCQNLYEISVVFMVYALAIFGAIAILQYSIGF